MGVFVLHQTSKAFPIRCWRFAAPRAITLLLSLSVFGGATLRADNFTTGDAAAIKFGVHEIALTGNGSTTNPFDTIATVRFTPPSGAANAKTAWAFYDGGNTWRARVYLTEAGPWTWSSSCETDTGLAGKTGSFSCQDSQLPGRLLPHPKNSRHWMNESGGWFLNLSDTAYFLLCAQDGNGDPVSDKTAKQFVQDDVDHGITSLRCFLASRRGGFAESSDQWQAWHFADEAFNRPRLDNLQLADRRLQMLHNDYPHVAIQLILFPLEAYARDDRFWTALTPTQRERLLRQLVARFAAYPQLLWLITNDAHYGPKFSNSNAMAREVGTFLMTHDPWQHPRSTGHARRLPFFFSDEAWATYIHIEHAHDLAAQQYAPYEAFGKPVFLGEDRYEQDHGPKLDPLHMRYWQRRLFWSWLLSGGSTNYGGRWWAVHPYSATGTLQAKYHKRPDVTFSKELTGLHSVRPIRDYFAERKIDLAEFIPDHALVSDPDSTTTARAPKLMRKDYSDFLIYCPHAAADDQAAQVNATQRARLRLNLQNTSGRFTTEWYRAADGLAQIGPTIDGGQQHDLASPWIGADVVLRLHQN